MSNASSRVVTTTRYEYICPTPVDMKDMALMQHWAREKFKQVNNREASYDDDIWVTAGEDEVIIFFSVVVDA
jgi:hypothetical protein